ncbi:hypothetical protein ACKGJN_15985 [Gillisia sp. Q332]|uniref:hypothetical protein n=1 Tax=Gillisia xinjiangensis TaxID=3384765 RepID=UPI00391C7185
MTAQACKTSILSSFHKMDNVLYEIRDQKGILINTGYDAWKQDVLRDLLQAGFIKLEKDLYTITAEGREVIAQDSILYYNKRVKIKKVTINAANKEEETGLFSNFWMLLIAGSVISIALLWFLMKYQVAEFML